MKYLDNYKRVWRVLRKHPAGITMKDLATYAKTSRGTILTCLGLFQEMHIIKIREVGRAKLIIPLWTK